MPNDILSILKRIRGLNAKVFSFVRLKLIASLAAFGPDGATLRELKAAFDINDGVLFANLNVLKEMGKKRTHGKMSPIRTDCPLHSDPVCY